MILQYHQKVLILMYKLVHLIYTLTVHGCLDKTISLILSLCNFSLLLFLKTTNGHLNICVFFCDQTHGRANKILIKIINFH